MIIPRKFMRREDQGLTFMPTHRNIPPSQSRSTPAAPPLGTGTKAPLDSRGWESDGRSGPGI